ncbi:MAG: PmoA family protein [Opitutaceae bacterium]|nr:PmoA family protein [Opitutaceae bacterium]
MSVPFPIIVPFQLFTFRPRCLLASLLLPLAAPATRAAEWKVFKANNDDLPGQNVTVTQDGKLVARFIHGEGQPIPYLALYDDQGRLLTNAGADKTGKTVGIEPHHRGIFIGWQQVKSDLGTSSLWGLGGGARGKAPNPSRMEVVALEKVSSDRDSATIVARIEWRAGNKNTAGSNLLLTEIRTMKIARPATGVAAQADTTFRLKPARDLSLDGNVQHAGIHMRVAHTVVDHAAETSYLWSPASAPTAGAGYLKTSKGQTGSVVGRDLQWGEFLFPLDGRWYSALQMNSPKNPVEEFSTREYGRFGFFFKKDLKRGEELEVTYRFLVRNAEKPAEAPKRSAAQVAQARREADAAYAKFIREVRK